MEGRALDVMGWMHRYGELELMLVLPDGSRTLIPAAWTDLEPSASASDPLSDCLGSVLELLRARAVVDALLSRLEPSQSERTSETAEEVTSAATAGVRGGGRSEDTAGRCLGRPRAGAAGGGADDARQADGESSGSGGGRR